MAKARKEKYKINDALWEMNFCIYNKNKKLICEINSISTTEDTIRLLDIIKDKCMNINNEIVKDSILKYFISKLNDLCLKWFSSDRTDFINNFTPPKDEKDVKRLYGIFLEDFYTKSYKNINKVVMLLDLLKEQNIFIKPTTDTVYQILKNNI